MIFNSSNRWLRSMVVYVPDLFKDMLEIIPPPPPVAYIGVLGCINSERSVLTHLQVPKNNSSRRYSKIIGYGDPKMIWGIYRIISNLYPGRNRFYQRNFAFLKIFVCLNKAPNTSFQLFLSNYKCISTVIISSTCP